MKKTFAAALLAIGFASTANADLSGADSAVLMWNAFECSVFAEGMKDEEEEERLFNIGYRSGHIFLAAVHAGSITDEEANKKIPWVVLASLGGPTDDFRLGIIFQWAVNLSHEEYYDVNLDDEGRIWKAKKKFEDANCAFLGRGGQ